MLPETRQEEETGLGRCYICTFISAAMFVKGNYKLVFQTLTPRHSNCSGFKDVWGGCKKNKWSHLVIKKIFNKQKIHKIITLHYGLFLRDNAEH